MVKDNLLSTWEPARSTARCSASSRPNGCFPWVVVRNARNRFGYLQENAATAEVRANPISKCPRTDDSRSGPAHGHTAADTIPIIPSLKRARSITLSQRNHAPSGPEIYPASVIPALWGSLIYASTCQDTSRNQERRCSK